MNKIRAVCYADDLLNNSLKGEVHSVFNRSINILSDENKLYTICQKDIFNGPMQIKLTITDFNRIKVDNKMPVTYVNQTIYIGKQEISLKGVDCNHLKKLEFPQQFPVTTKALIIIIEEKITNQLDTSGFFMKKTENDIERALLTLLKQYSDLLVEGMIVDSKEMIETAIKHLIGLGHGLTPSGDDFLTGVSLVVNSSNYPFQKTRLLVNQIITTHQNQTNMIARNELMLAREGKNLEPVIRFIELVYQGVSFEKIESTISKILMIGSSSGSDILAGILEAFKVTIAKLTSIKRV